MTDEEFEKYLLELLLEKEMHYYINYRFKNIIYDDDIIMGCFSVLECDGDVECDFVYDRNTESIDLYNENKAKEEILPIPIHWLLYKLKEQGYLNENESKISY